MKRIKLTVVASAVILITVMIAATLIEKFRGTEFVAAHIYHAPWFVALWALLAVASAVYILRRRLRGAALALHLGLELILAGALVTWLAGQRGTFHLRAEHPTERHFTGDNGRRYPLPFAVRLDEFRIEYYAGTRAPMDFVSELSFIDGADTLRRTVSMNRIARYRGYRFYQSGYDAEGGGTTLSVAYDPWGIGISYLGYALLVASMIGLLVARNGPFRRLLRHPALRASSAAVIFLLCGAGAQAAENRPQTLPQEVAAELGALGVYYNDRVCPLSTLARECTTKLCGRSSWRGRSAGQVLAGWLFYYDDWTAEPMIRVKSADVRQRLEIGGRYARLTDFQRAIRLGRLQELPPDRSVREADERFRLAGLLASGQMLRLFPYTDPVTGELHWAAPVDNLPAELPGEQRIFIRRSMDYLHELVLKRDYAAACDLLRKIGDYQRQTCSGRMPSPVRLRAERLYNRLGYSFPAAIVFVLIGIIGFAVRCREMLRNRRSRRIGLLLTGVLIAGWFYLSVLLALRGYVCGHWPMSNGFETMQFMAWCTWLVTLLFRRRFLLLIPMGLLVGGLAMMVSVMGSSNPQITPLMPVLNSPLLSIHVMLVMAAYSLLALTACNGVAGIAALRRHPQSAERLRIVGAVMLYPAVFALAAGIFVGAVWANVSWGRYWGWDPKEVWALITLLVYATALHSGSLPAFRRPDFFHTFCIAAFLTVIVTYFGVNFLLGGMHSYA